MLYSPALSALTAAAVMGFVSLLLQTILIRMLLSVFSGNELNIGITLALWILFVGTGSILGSRFNDARFTGWSFLLVALIAPLTVAAIALLHNPALMTHSLPVMQTALLATLLLAPLCLCLGMQFPLLLRYGGGQCTGRQVYACEAAGAFAAGVLFTFVLAQRSSPVLLTLLLCIAYGAVGALMLKRPALLIPLLALLLLSGRALDLDFPERRSETVLETKYSKYGEIRREALRDNESIYFQGELFTSYPQPQQEELVIHPPFLMALWPMASSQATLRVLIIGGSPATIREALKYPLSSLDFIEMDPALIETSITMLSASDRQLISDPRVSIKAMDGRGFVSAQKTDTYNVIILNIPPPSTAALNRFYTLEFFRELARISKSTGVVSLRLPTSAGYVSRAMKEANGTVLSTLSAVFPHILLSNEEYGLLMASEGTLSTERMLNNPVRLTLHTSYITESIIQDAFDPLRMSLHAQRLSSVTSINTDARPTAYSARLSLFSLMLGSRLTTVILSHGRAVLTSVLILLALAAVTMRRRTGSAVLLCMATTGFFGMAVTVDMLLAFQIRYGYIYTAIGMLSALFMAGAAVGAFVIRKPEAQENDHRVISILLGLELAMVLFSCLLSQSGNLLPGDAYGTVYYLAVLTAGTLCGAVYAAASTLKGMHPSVLYGVDLTGAFAGALLCAVILIPAMGLAGTSLYIAAIKGISLLTLLSARAARIA